MENIKVSSIASSDRAGSSVTQIAKMSEVRHFTVAEFNSLKIVHAGEEGSLHLKVFRDLRTQLMKRTDWRNFVCLVTSAAPGGSSYVAINLAATISLDKSKTSLLVDANLYAPCAQWLLPVPAQLGLMDYLDDVTAGTEDIVYASGVPRMRVVPMGNNPEGGVEKISSARMREFFSEIKNRYADRYVVVDGPSAADCDAEIRILAELCDFVVLVVPYGKVTPAQLDNAIEKIGRERLAGVVYNWC